MAAKKDPDEVTDGDGAKKGGKLKLILIIVPLLLVIGAGVYFLVLKPSSDATAAASTSASAEGSEEGTEEGEESTPTSTFVEGAVITVEPITINLANGHFLKLGLALQATADAGEEVTPAKALDAAIAQFSGNTVDELATAEGREESKKELTKTIKKVYEKKVYEVYYTTFPGDYCCGHRRHWPWMGRYHHGHRYWPWMGHRRHHHHW